MSLDIIILAGGFGTRLAKIVSSVPKCLAPVAGVPFLDILLFSLQQLSSNIILSLGFRSQLVVDHVQQIDFGAAIKFSVEPFPLGTGGGFKSALRRSHSQHVVLINGDTFVDSTSLLNFYHDFKARKSKAHIMTKVLGSPHRFGRLKVDGIGRVLSFNDGDHEQTSIINCGVYCFDRKFLEQHLVNYPDVFSFEDTFLKNIASGGALITHTMDPNGIFIDIGVADDYATAQIVLKDMASKASSISRRPAL